jgi:hypothetical protein
MMPRESTHWRQSEGLRGGAALGSLDVRRVMALAAARKSWRGRMALRLLSALGRLKAWRARLERLGRGREVNQPAANTPRASVPNGTP